MSDRAYFHGINKVKTPTTKVLQPPGGKTSFNFYGGDIVPPRAQVTGNRQGRDISSVFTPPDDVNNNTTIPTENEHEETEPLVNDGSAPQDGRHPSAGVISSSNACVRGRGGPAGTTNAMTANSSNAIEGGRSSTRVMAPPGGKSSFSFG